MTRIPIEVSNISKELEKSGYEAYLVGGCVRDFLLGREPKDWDIATNAKPEEVQKIFSTFAKATADRPATVYENKFGTVGVKTESNDLKLKVIEVTTYRKEGKYTDKRHPDEIKFAKTIEEDLARRDFTVNAMALSMPVMARSPEGAPLGRAKQSLDRDSLIDSFNGQRDLNDKIIRTVGNPDERFNEDALRLMRAVRLAAELNFTIEKRTAEAVKKHAGLLEMVSKERIRDEFVKLIMSDNAARGINTMTEYGLMKYVMPEILEGVGVGQNKHHIYTVYEHNVRALDYSARKNYSLIVRLSSLLHDVAKPRTKEGDGLNSTFYNHEVVGERMALKILDRLKFSKEVVEKVAHLVRHHLFYYNVGEVTEAGVRRFLRKARPENIDDLIKVREADRIGSGVPKAVPYKLRHLLFMIDKVKQDPIDIRKLKVNGNDIMKIAEISPSPRVGQIALALLEEIIEDPQKNDKKYLSERIKDLNKLSDGELSKIAEEAKKKKEEFASGLEKEIKEKHRV